MPGDVFTFSPGVAITFLRPLAYHLLGSRSFLLGPPESHRLLGRYYRLHTTGTPSPAGSLLIYPGVAMHPRLGSVLSLPQTTRYKIGCAVIRTTWAGGKPLTICMVPARHQRLYPESPHGHHTREGRGAVQYQAPRGTYHRQSVMQCTHQSCSTYTPAGTSTFF